MSAHTLGTCYEMVGANFGGIKQVAGTFTGTASYDSGGSVLNLSTVFSDECRGGFAWDKAGEFSAIIVPTASTNLAATTKALVRGISWDDVTLAHNATCFDAAGTTDSAAVWTQPANSLFVGCRITLDTPFVATSMTALTVEIGDAGDNNGFFAGTLDLVAGSAGDTDDTNGAEAGDWTNAFVTSGTARTLYATATGANLSTTSAGQITVRFYFIPEDYLTGTLNTGNFAEVHSGQVLSGSTFQFVAWGTDA